MSSQGKILLKGNEVMCEAAIKAGCRFFTGNPITPQNEVPEHMPKRIPEVGGIFVQAESEIATINMIFGVFDHYGGLSMGETVSSELQAGDVVGFDIVVDTRWADDGFGMLSENLMTGKSEDAGKFARYMLVDGEDPGDCTANRADLDNNCVLNVKDLAIFVENWLGESPLVF